MKNAQIQAAAVLLGLALLALPCRSETTLIPGGGATTWHYYDKNTEPQAEWNKPDFSDAAWATGTAPLGYGAPGLGTTLNEGPSKFNRNVTAYFRTSFDVEKPQELKQLRFLVRADDGLVVYLNGKEVVRSNMPDGAVAFTTTAPRGKHGLIERFYRKFTADTSALVPGKNSVAVEVHQSSPKSPDLYLDLSLISYNVGEDLTAVMAPEAKEAAETYRYKHRVPPEIKIPDGYVDGGRGTQFQADGHARASREIIVVDRKHDVILQELIKFAKSDELKKLDPVDRAMEIAYKIIGDGEYNRYQECEAASNLLARDYQSQPIRIGDVSKICGATVCRHRSLLFKILADEAGLHAVLTRGNVEIPNEKSGAHAWNEIILDNGTRMIVDCMSDEEDIVIPESKAKRYLTVDDKPWYGTTTTTAPEKKAPATGGK